MGRKKGVPSYCLHKATGQAVVRVNGRDVYLGKHGSPESRRAYAELLARLEVGGDPPERTADLKVSALVDRYDSFASNYYVKAGKPTRQLERVRRSLGLAVGLFGETPAALFGPQSLSVVRDRMVSLGWSRKHVNSCVGCVRRCWRWGASRELVPLSCYESLRTLDGLRAGRTPAKETPPVGPVDDDVVAVTVASMGPLTADMVRLQRLTAMRAGEVCALRVEEIDRVGDVWSWRPGSHKMSHAGKVRVIFFGPRAQAILLKHIETVGGVGYVFSPKRTLMAIRADMRQRRRTRVQPSQSNRGKDSPKRAPGDCYTANSYQKAIRDACDAAGVARWHSHQLRHSAATEIRREFGADVAQTILGHSAMRTTEIYALPNIKAAIESVRRAG